MIRHNMGGLGLICLSDLGPPTLWVSYPGHNPGLYSHVPSIDRSYLMIS